MPDTSNKSGRKGVPMIGCRQVGQTADGTLAAEDEY